MSANVCECLQTIAWCIVCSTECTAHAQIIYVTCTVSSLILFVCIQMEMDDNCLFEWKFKCEESSEEIKNAGPARVQTIIKFSKEYQDDVHINLQESLQSNPERIIKCHRSSV